MDNLTKKKILSFPLFDESYTQDFPLLPAQRKVESGFILDISCIHQEFLQAIEIY